MLCTELVLKVRPERREGTGQGKDGPVMGPAHTKVLGRVRAYVESSEQREARTAGGSIL